MKRLLFTSYLLIFVAFTLLSFRVYSKEISDETSVSSIDAGHLHIQDDEVSTAEQNAENMADIEPLGPPEPIETWKNHIIKKKFTCLR